MSGRQEQVGFAAKRGMSVRLMPVVFRASFTFKNLDIQID